MLLFPMQHVLFLLNGKIMAPIVNRMTKWKNWPKISQQIRMFNWTIWKNTAQSEKHAVLLVCPSPVQSMSFPIVKRYSDIQTNDGWRSGSVKIRMPAEDKIKRVRGETHAPELEIRDIHYRSLLHTIFETLDNPNAPTVHYTPFQEYWKPSPDSNPERVYGEFYSSDCVLKMHEEVQNLPKTAEIDNFALPISIYSDSMRLANFGPASLWPMYGFLGGVSKYLRCKPSEIACHHLAYIPSVCAHSTPNMTS